jgi:hypothetical protein
MRTFWAAAPVALLVLIVTAVASAAGQRPPESSAEAALAARYSPVIAVRVGESECDADGERYGPVPVEAVLGHPEVVLLRPKDKDSPERVIARGPTSADIARLGRDYALDLPGNALNPGCRFARDLAARVAAEELHPTVYAHVAREPGVRGIALQYWIYWYYNQFNNLHESDWEMIQVAFDEDSVEGALAAQPSKVAYAQHAGGEVAEWDAPKVQKAGTHPVVFAAAGSHASYFGGALYLGNGEGGAGLGCDDTREPLRRVRPDVVTVATDPDPGGPNGWLTFEGLWGQIEGGFNGPPDGPAAKRQWREPFRWMAGLRTGNPEVPGGGALGTNVSRLFCGTVEAVSSFYNLAARSRATALVVLGVLVVGIGLPLRRTRWSPAEPVPLRQRRAVGQIVRTTAAVRRAHGGTFFLLGLFVIPALLAAAGLQALLLDLLGMREWLGDRGWGSLRALIALVLVLLAVGVGYAFCSAAITSAMALIERGAPVGVRASVENLRGRGWSAVGGTLGTLVVCVVLAVTVIGIPVAVWLSVRWLFLQDAIVLRGLGVRDGLRQSAALVRGSWWRILGAASLLVAIGVVAAPVVGFALILFTGLPLSVVNLVAAVVFALAVPWIVIARVLLYLDLETRREGESKALG